MRTLVFTVTPEFDGRRLKAFLRGSARCSGHLINTLKNTSGGILINGVPSRTIDPVRTGDTVALNIAETSTPPLVFDYPLSILFEDADLLVVNKPAGLSMHPTYNHKNGTLANAVASYLAQKGEPPACMRAVGRLDKGTSGVAVLAKNLYAASVLSGEPEKEYLALIGGRLTGEGVIDVPIYRPFPDKTLRAVGGGDAAVTRYKALREAGTFTLVRVFPQTGRTHQIRVHFQYIGFPLVGDELYGGEKSPFFDRPALHCEKVTLRHPVTRETMTFFAPLPSDFLKATAP